MNFIAQANPAVVVIEPRVFGDARGYFFESWREDRFTERGIAARFVQDNVSRSTRGVLRGLHYQLQKPQGKLVRVTQGEVYDVAVDLRRGSPHFGSAVGVHLSAENHRMLWVPAGFAHGFLVLSESAEFAYKCTDYYAPEFERSLRWDDPALKIAWPLEPGQAPAVSDKDARGALLHDAETFA